MKKAIVLAGVLSVIGVSALGAAQTTDRSQGQAHPEQAQQNAANLSKQDKDFFEEAGQDNLFELKAAQLALTKASSDDVKKYAQKMVDDHTKLQQQMVQVAQKKGLTVPQALDRKRQDELDKLAKVQNGAKFDKEYMSHLVSDHKDDAKKFDKEAKDGKDADIKGLAAGALPTLQDHETQAKALEERVKK